MARRRSSRALSSRQRKILDELIMVMTTREEEAAPADRRLRSVSRKQAARSPGVAPKGDRHDREE